MHVGVIPQRLVSRLYYSVWPLLRPRGFQGQLCDAYLKLAGADWERPEEIRQRQLDKLHSLWNHAVSQVPYYRRLAQTGNIPKTIETFDDLTAIPLLTKEIIEHEAETLLADNIPREQLRPNATGGSTGAPLHFWSDEPALMLSNAGERWAVTLAGLQSKSPIAYFWGAARFERSTTKDLRDRLEQAISNRLFFNCFRMTQADYEHAHRQLCRFRPEAIVGYSSALVEFAAYLRRQGIHPKYPSKAIISAAETLHDISRRELHSTFDVPIFDRYGSREAGLIAMECDRHEGLHIDCENIYVELLDNPETPGLQKIIVTKLNQRGMPFMRYRIEDLAEGPISFCSCGRGYPVLPRIIGRVTETIRSPEGVVHSGALFPHLLKDCGIAAFQIIQNSDYSVDVAMVKTAEQTRQQDEQLRRVITDTFGPSLPVTFRYVEHIERTSTGKLLPVISHAPAVSAPEKESADHA